MLKLCLLLTTLSFLILILISIKNTSAMFVKKKLEKILTQVMQCYLDVS